MTASLIAGRLGWKEEKTWGLGAVPGLFDGTMPRAGRRTPPRWAASRWRAD